MEPFQDKKAGTKRTKFGIRRLLTLKKSILDSFSIFSRMEREDATIDRTDTQLKEEVGQPKVTSSQSRPNFTSVIEFPLNFLTFSEDKEYHEAMKNYSEEMFESATKPTIAQTDRCPVTHEFCWSSPDTGKNVHSYYKRDRKEQSFYNTIPERGPSARSFVSPPFNETAGFSESSKDPCQAKRFSSLTLPVQGKLIQERMHSPVYETIGPAYPPKGYDLQKEHSDIETHRRNGSLTQGEDRQSESHIIYESCMRNPKRPSVDRMRQDNRINESLWNERAVDGKKLTDHGKPGFIDPTLYAQNKPVDVNKKDQGTQTSPELFDIVDDGITLSENHISANACNVAYMRRIQDDYASKHAPLQSIQSRSVNYIGHKNNGFYIVSQETLQNSTTGRMLRYPEHLSESKFCPYQETMSWQIPLNNLVVLSDLQGNSRNVRTKDRGSPVAVFSHATSSELFSQPSAYSAGASIDDTRSVFSSEGADSDFVFYPSVPASSVETRNTVAMVDPTDTSAAASARFNSQVYEDKVMLKHHEDSSKSDLCGSSLDEVTRQFFLDDDALSDDVFMEEAEQHKYPFWKYSDDPSPRTLDSIEENCPNVTFFTTTEYGQSKTISYPNSTCTFVGERGTAPYTINREKNKMGTSIDESLRDTGFSCSSVKSDEMYAYKYDDIEEVLENFKDLSASVQINLGENEANDPNVPNMTVTNHLQSDKFIKDGACTAVSRETHRYLQDCENTVNRKHEQEELHSQIQDSELSVQRLSSQRSSSDNCDEIDSRFADMFDSLRKNSVQSKARQMWRKRRSNRGRNFVAAQNRAFIDVNKHPGPKDKEIFNDVTEILYTLPSVNHGKESLPPLKPLRGILKKSVLPQPVSVAERNLCNRKHDNTNSQIIRRRRARSLGVEVYPLERTEALYSGEIRDMQYQVAKAHSPQFPVNAPDFNTILDQAGDISWKRRSRSLNTEMHSRYRNEADLYLELKNAQGIDTFGKLRTETVEGHNKFQSFTACIKAPTTVTNKAASSNRPTRCFKGDSDAFEKITCPRQSTLHEQGEIKNCDYRTASPIPSSPGTRPSEVRPITARKNSLEVYRWSTCLQRRRKLQDRRDGKSGCIDNADILQHVISVCPSEPPAATL